VLNGLPSVFLPSAKKHSAKASLPNVKRHAAKKISNQILKPK